MGISFRLTHHFPPRFSLGKLPGVFKNRLRRLTRLVLFGRHRRPAATRPNDEQQRLTVKNPRKLTCPDKGHCEPLPYLVHRAICQILEYLWFAEHDDSDPFHTLPILDPVRYQLSIAWEWFNACDFPPCHGCPLSCRAPWRIRIRRRWNVFKLRAVTLYSYIRLLKICRKSWATIKTFTARMTGRVNGYSQKEKKSHERQ